jgi:hypothetical protein
MSGGVRVHACWNWKYLLGLGEENDDDAALVIAAR